MTMIPWTTYEGYGGGGSGYSPYGFHQRALAFEDLMQQRSDWLDRSRNAQTGQSDISSTSGIGGSSSLAGILGGFDDGGQLDDMGDIFRTLLFLGGKSGGGNQSDAITSLFSGIKL